MLIKKLIWQKISENIIEQCSQLANVCNEADGFKSSFFIDNEQPPFLENVLPTLFLAYNDFNELMGFLSVYIYDEYECEVCLFVHPEYRRRKLGTSLLSEFDSSYEDFDIQIPVISDNSTGKSFLHSVNFTYLSTECKFYLEKNSWINYKTSVGTLNVLENDDSTIFELKINDVVVGNMETYISQNIVCIHDVHIKENNRGKGYSKILLGLALNYIFEIYDAALLHVTKENVVAYNLYNKMNFKCIDKFEYWHNYH